MSHKNSFKVFLRKLMLSSFFALVLLFFFSFSEAFATSPASPFTSDSLISIYKKNIEPVIPKKTVAVKENATTDESNNNPATISFALQANALASNVSKNFSHLWGGYKNYVLKLNKDMQDVFADYYDNYTSELAHIFYDTKTTSIPVGTKVVVASDVSASVIAASDPLSSVSSNYVSPSTKSINSSDILNAFKSYTKVQAPPSTPPAVVVTKPSVVTTTARAQGLQGPQGIQGPQGSTGPRGPAGTSSLTTPELLAQAGFVSKSFFDRQVDRIYSSTSDGIQDLSSSLGEEVDTDLLTVSGNATIGGNLTITGTCTGCGGGGTVGPGTINEIAYFDTANTVASLTVATYPSLTELSYAKGVTSAIQTQLNAKANSAGALTQFVGNGNWRVFYSDGSGDVQELALGALGTFLQANGVSSAPTWATPAGSGDVTKVGTPVDNQVGVWTGDGTLEGDTALTYDAATDTLTSVTFAGALTGIASGNALPALSNLASVAINTTLVSDTDNTDALGTTAIAWSDLFLGSGGVITFNSAPSTPDITLTHSADTLTLAGGDLALGANNITMTGSLGATGAGKLTKVWATDAEFTNLPTVNGGTLATALSLSSYAPLASPTFSTSVTGSYLTASEILITDGSKNIVSAPVATYPSLTELSYVKGASSAIQTQIGTKAATATTMTIAGTANQITSSAGAQDLSANRTWTLSLPADVLIPTVLTVPNTGLHVLDSNASHDLIIAPGSDLTADHTLTVTTGDADTNVNLTAVTDEYVLAYDTGTNTWRGVASSGGAQTPWSSDISAAGFTLYGNSTSGGSLTLSSTSDATKGYVLINPTGGSVGVGTPSPLLKLDVAGSGRFTGTATSVLTGSIDPAASTTVPGVNTLFTTELVVGDRITVTGETRTVTAIASDTSLTVDTAFSNNNNDTSPDKLPAMFIVRDSSNVVKMVMNDSNLDVGSGGITHVWGTGITSISSLETGSLNLEDDAGAASWVDMNVTGTPLDGTVESYTAKLSGNSVLTIYGTAIGAAGGVDNIGVGIGTTTPAGLFHVSSDTAALGQTYLTQANASADSFDLNFRKARGTGATPTVITTADELGVINFTGYGGAAGYITGAAIKGISSGTIADNRVPGQLSFWTGTDATTSVLTERMVIKNDGGIEFPAEAGSNANDYVCIDVTGGAISSKATACTGSSSLRYKKNIENLSLGLDAVLAMRPVSFDWKLDYIKNPNAPRQVGFIAEEMEQISPLFVTYENGQVEGVEYMKLTSVLAKAIQDLDLKVEGFEERIATLEANNGGGNDGGIINTLGQYASDFFNGVIISVENGVAYMKGIIVDTLKVGSPAKRTGVTLYDEVTGDPYCLSIANGEQKTTAGECAVIESESEPPACVAPQTLINGVCADLEIVEEPPVCIAPQTLVNNVCQDLEIVVDPPTCSDGIQNQDETSIDTGGACSPEIVELPAEEIPDCVAPKTLVDNVCVDPLPEPAPEPAPEPVQDSGPVSDGPIL
ncbi:MAG: tail fiber domain-containing protein [Candidatus Paceibacterota bacterium]|jgi:hypothetical protein